MPQSPIVAVNINSTRQLPDADLPVDPTYLVEVQPPTGVLGPRQKITVADIIGGGGGVAGSGTATHLALWSNGTTIGDSIITDDGSAATVGGNLVATGTFQAAGSTVTTLHATGAATLDSTLAAGNTTITGTAHVTSTAALDGGVTLGSFLTLHGVAFGSLPGSPAVGMVMRVTDSNTTTWGATVAGGGTDDILAWYDGTNWSVIGKVGA